MIQHFNRWNWFRLPHFANQNHPTDGMLLGICEEYELIAKEMVELCKKHNMEVERLRQKTEALERDYVRCL